MTSHWSKTMTPKYVIYHGTLGGFLTEAATYSSEVKLAQEFDRDEAIEICRAKYVAYLDESPAVPVLLADMKEIRK